MQDNALLLQKAGVYEPKTRDSIGMESEMAKSLFKEIYESIKRGIEQGTYAYQSLLLSENDFCRQYNCSRSTIRRAISELARDGYVQPMQGKGVRVIWQPQDKEAYSGVGVIESFAQMGKRLGFNPTTKLVAFEHLICDAAIAKRTGFAEGDQLVLIERQRLADGTPVTFEHTYFNDSEIPGLTPDIAYSGTYAYIQSELGLSIVTSKRTITIEEATERDVDLLGLGKFRAVGVMRSQSFDSNGIMFEHSEVRENPYFFTVTDIATVSPVHENA